MIPYYIQDHNPLFVAADNVVGAGQAEFSRSYHFDWDHRYHQTLGICDTFQYYNIFLFKHSLYYKTKAYKIQGHLLLHVTRGFFWQTFFAHFPVFHSTEILQEGKIQFSHDEKKSHITKWSQISILAVLRKASRVYYEILKSKFLSYRHSYSRRY